VRSVRAVEPSAGGRRLAARRIASTPVPVVFVGLDGEALPLEDDSADHMLITWTLCTIPAVDRALAEVVRVLRPSGTLHFIEHGRAPDPKIARRQDRFTPIQRRVFGGCHLNRPIDALISQAGLKLTKVERYFMPGPKMFGYTFEGIATKG
jgi:ubiquinone/menaquinone biosynthesis C-methylase UbiE